MGGTQTAATETAAAENPAPSRVVLIVDGMPHVRAAIARALEGTGFRAVEAVDVADAMRMLAKQIPYSFIVSSQIGKEDGLALVNGLQNIPKTKSRPIVLLVSSAQSFTQLKEAAPPERVIPIIKYNALPSLLARVLEAHESIAQLVPVDIGSGDNSGVVMDKKAVDALDAAFAFFQELVERIERNDLPGPMMPKLLENTRQIVRRPNLTFTMLGDFVRQHATLSSRILSLSNSAYYARTGIRLNSVDAAIGRLGLDTSSSVLLAVAALGYVAGADQALKKLIFENLRLGLAAGLISEVLAKIAGGVKPDEAYTVGLFHNIGPTFLLHSLAILKEKKHKSVAEIRLDTLPTLIKSQSRQLNRLVCKGMKLPEAIIQLYDPIPDDPRTMPPMIRTVHQGIWFAERITANQDVDLLELDVDAKMIGLDEELLTEVEMKLPAVREALNAYGTDSPPA